MPRLFASLSLMKRLWAGLLVLWFTQGLMAEELSAKGIEQLKQAAEKAITVLKNKDAQAMVELVPPKLIDLAGGKEKFVAMLEDQFKIFDREMMTFKNFKVKEPVSITRTEDGWYAYVPIEMTLSVKQESVLSQSYLLGYSSDQGESWQLVDTAGLKSIKDAQKIFPSYPKDLKIPKSVFTKN